MPGRFGTLLTAMVTPFRDDYSLDLDGAQQLARHLFETGTDAVVVAGSTGEAATLSEHEKGELFRAVVEAADGRGRVIAGTGTYDTAETITLNGLAEKAGCDAVLVVTPYYSRPPQRGLIAHFTKVAESTDLPVILYNIPSRTACLIEPDTVLRLASQVENIVAVKDSTGDFQSMSRIVKESPPDFDVYSGDDWAAFASAMLGAVGLVSVASHLVGDRIREMLELAFGGDAAAARKIHEDLLPIFKGLFVTSNPIPVKAALEIAGRPAGPPRLPLVPASPEERQVIEQAMRDVGAL
jgi:4-hydroxy-tetrahydrodipicolinate synthase